MLGETGVASALALMLSSLHYDVRLDNVSSPSEDARLCQAWREFESTAGLKTDGIVTFSEMGRLGELVDQLSAKSVTMPTKFLSDSGDGIFVTGTWVMQGDQIADPLNANEILCDRSSCTEHSARLIGGTTLMMDSRAFRVTRWTNEEVEATSGTACRIVRLLINRRTQQVSEIATDRTSEGCPVIGALGKPRVSTLEDGLKVSLDYGRARRDEARSAMSQQARDIVKRVTEPPESAPSTGRD
ncbi:MAG: hypothetical protein ABS36_08810 [Acidobacteria bacterium SCN 69-37]|nr:MAG: hypothetical protein ABS36_08810 [Acidobacteria bacterium SCN 69-37]